MMRLELTIDGENVTAEAAPGATLLEVLRSLGYTSVKDGCANGDCGACAVLLDGRAVTSCLVFAASLRDEHITTIEGLAGDGGDLHPLQQAMLDTGGVQCGFCIPAMTLTALDLLAHHPHSTREGIAAYLTGNLCRCTGYVKQVEAVERAIRNLEEAGLV